MPVSPSLLLHQEDQSQDAGLDTEPVVQAPLPAKRRESETLTRWESTPLKEVMKTVESDMEDWDDIMAFAPSTACQACVAEAPQLGGGSLAKMANLAYTFFRCSALALQYQMLEAQQPRDDRAASTDNFLTLGMADFMMAANDGMREAKLQAIVDSAESEAGQQVLRDMILSFTLPPKVVGVRRVPLLSRQANAVATEQYTGVLGAAHECAMRGAEWTWKQDDDEIHKIAALLAGLCIQMAGRGGTADTIRKSDAFGGRVSLPFLETGQPAANVSRLGFVPHRNEWIVYKVDRKGIPTVQLKHCGFEGLCLAVLAVMSK